MVKKIFEQPSMEVIYLKKEDVVTASIVLPPDFFEEEESNPIKPLLQ